MQEGISGSEENVDEVDSSVKANVKIKPSRHQKNLENLGHYEKKKYPVIIIEEEENRVKGMENILHKMSEKISLK